MHFDQKVAYLSVFMPEFAHKLYCGQTGIFKQKLAFFRAQQLNSYV